MAKMAVALVVPAGTDTARLLEALPGLGVEAHTPAGVTLRGTLQAADVPAALVALSSVLGRMGIEPAEVWAGQAERDPVLVADWIGTEEAGRLLGITHQHVRVLVEAGRIVGRRIARDVLVSRASVEHYLASGPAVTEVDEETIRRAYEAVPANGRGLVRGSAEFTEFVEVLRGYTARGIGPTAIGRVLGVTKRNVQQWLS